MKDEFIIINKTTIQKRIEYLEEAFAYQAKHVHSRLYHETYLQLTELKHVLSQSTPLIPEIENAFHEGTRVPYDKSKPLNKWWVNVDQRLEKYISNLKLDI